MEFVIAPLGLCCLLLFALSAGPYIMGELYFTGERRAFVCVCKKRERESTAHRTARPPTARRAHLRVRKRPSGENKFSTRNQYSICRGLVR